MTADVEQAYLRADIKEKLYIEIPNVLKGCPEFQGFNCLRLRKGLYGTKQAGRGWYEMLKGAILRAGLEEAPEDPCLYVRRDCNGRVDLTVCTVVDDGADGAFNEFLDNLKAQGIDLDEKSIGPAREYRCVKIGKPIQFGRPGDPHLWCEVWWPSSRWWLLGARRDGAC